MTRTLLKRLVLPFDVVRTLYEGGSEVRLYRNEITEVLQIGKRVSALGLEDTAAFREATLLQGIRHDHIVPVYDVAVVEDDAADPLLKIIEMIIPYYERGSAFDALQKGERFSLGEAVRLTRDALVGLNELHEVHGLIHRDMKSANVFLDERGRLRVGDLGLAVPMDENGTGEAFPGAQPFTAPETYGGARSDRRTDIYGIGLILLELMNGPFPYEDYTKLEVSQRLVKGRRALRDKDLGFPSQAPLALRRILNRAIAKKPADRFASAREMLDSLDHVSFIDWRQIEDSDTQKVWEGPLTGPHGRRYRVVGKPRKRGSGWKYRGFQHVTTWRRCIPDQVVTSADGRDARKFFDHMLKHASSR